MLTANSRTAYSHNSLQLSCLENRKAASERASKRESKREREREREADRLKVFS